MPATLYDMLRHLMLARYDATGVRRQVATRLEEAYMTALQTLRSTLKDGATLTLAKRADGYHIGVAATDGSGRMVRREVVHPRLEQALFLVMERAGVEIG